MRSLVLLIVVLFFTACSPKYKVVKEYVPPIDISTNALTQAICAQKRDSCRSSCKEAFNRCKPKALKLAKKRYDEKMKLYVRELERYARVAEDAEFKRDIFYVNGGFYDDNLCLVSPYAPYYGFRHRMFLYDSFPRYIGRRPKKPSLEVERLKAESEICELDCGCEKLYDECFVAHGGVIKTKKVCIENCP